MTKNDQEKQSLLGSNMFVQGFGAVARIGLLGMLRVAQFSGEQQALRSGAVLQ